MILDAIEIAASIRVWAVEQIIKTYLRTGKRDHYHAFMAHLATWIEYKLLHYHNTKGNKQ